MAQHVEFTQSASVEEWQRPSDTDDDPNLNWVAVRIGKAAPNSKFGTVVNPYDLENGAEEMPWTREEWLADTLRKVVAGMPLPIEHDPTTSGGGINRTFVDPRDGSLLMTAYIHNKTANGRTIMDGIRSGHIKDASIRYDADIDSAGRLRSCRIREVSLTPRGKVFNSRIQVCNSAGKDEPGTNTTKAPERTDIKQAAAMSDAMQEDAAPAKTAAKDLTLEQWMSMPIDQQATVDRQTQTRLMFEMQQFVKSGQEAQRQREEHERQLRERAEREGKERFDRYRSVFVETGKKRNIVIDGNENAEQGLLSLFNQPETSFYGNVVGGLADDYLALQKLAEQKEQENEALRGALAMATQKGGRVPQHYSTATTTGKRQGEPELTPSGKRQTTDTQPKEEMGSRHSSASAALPSAPSSALPSEPAPPADAQAIPMLHQLPRLRMNHGAGGFDNHGLGILATPQVDPHYIDPRAVAKLVAGRFDAAAQKNMVEVACSATNSAIAMLMPAIQRHADREPKPAFEGSYPLADNKRRIYPAGYLAEVPSVRGLLDTM